MLIIVIFHKRGVSYISKKYIRLLKYFFFRCSKAHDNIFFFLIIVIISNYL